MNIICIMGKSGTGKSQLEKALCGFGYTRGISYTTKKPGVGEVNNVDYHFVTKEEFKRLIEKNIVMEYTVYAGEYYGTPHPIGVTNYVVVVEPHGYEAIKAIYKNQVTGVYIDTPEQEIKRRVAERGRDDIDTIHQREEEDSKLFNGIKNNVEITLDGTESTDKMVVNILKYISENRKE